MRNTISEVDELGIPYAIAGALAANAHGHARTTEDVDVLLTREGLTAFKARWRRDRRACSPASSPATGKPKPVAFPDPSVGEPSADGYSVLPLRTLLVLKIASGMTAPHRVQDLADAIQLIRRNALPQDWPVDGFVADRYRELWALAQITDPE